MGKDIGLTDEQVKESLMFASDKTGETMTIAMRPEDAKKWFGVVPPDLSVISRARGVDWLYTYLRTFYIDDTKPIGTNNLVFKDSAMPHILWQQQGYKYQDDEGHLTNITKKPIIGAKKLSKDDFSPSSFEYKLLTAADNQPTAFDYNVMVRDLVNFLAYIGEPSKIQRLAMAEWVLLYILLFIVVAYFMKKAFWEDIH
jgi:ubiquinol-cytochrome c reductase cytochrome c1 subunit